MRQFLNFPNGENQYKNLKINVAGLRAGAYSLGSGEGRIHLPLLACYNVVASITFSGADQSDEKYQTYADAINSALEANPGGVSIDVAGPLSGLEVTNL